MGVYQNDGTDPDEFTDYLDECVGVCSIVDLEEFPVTEPNPADCPKGFRQSFFDAVFDSAYLVLGDPSNPADPGIWERIQRDAQGLIDSLNAADVLELGTPVILA